MAITRVVHCKVFPCNVYIGRPTFFGNPWSHKESKIATFKVETREDAVNAYRDWLMGVRFTNVLQENRKKILQNLMSLNGKDLGCWCAPASCHGDVLVELIKKVQSGEIVIEKLLTD